MDQPLRILAIVNVPWDPRFGAARVWIELAEAWTAAGHHVEKFCLTDAFPEKTSSSAVAAFRLLLFPFRAARFVRRNARNFDVIDALIGTLPFSKKSLRFEGLLVARSVGLYRLYEKFERDAAKRWPPPKGKLIGRPFYRFFYRRGRAASEASVRHSDLLNLPNSDELVCVRDEMRLQKAVIMKPYGLAPGRRRALLAEAAPAEVRRQKKKVVFIGMWSARKGAKDWGQIIRHVRSRVPEARFLFLGAMVAVDTVWSDLGFGPVDYVEVLEQFDPDELPRFLADCAVGAFPSYVEGFGMAVVEQLAAGLPTVAYNAAGPRDILRDNFPELLVAPGDTAKFSGKIVEILDSDLAKYQDLATRSAALAAQFSWPEIARETADEYHARLGAASHTFGR